MHEHLLVKTKNRISFLVHVFEKLFRCQIKLIKSKIQSSQFLDKITSEKVYFSIFIKLRNKKLPFKKKLNMKITLVDSVKLCSKS